MKKSEMDKLRKFIKFSIEDGWRHVPMGLAQLLDTFEVESEFTLPVEPEECDDGNCERCMFQEHLIGIPCDRIVMPFDKMTEAKNEEG